MKLIKKNGFQLSTNEKPSRMKLQFVKVIRIDVWRELMLLDVVVLEDEDDLGEDG